MATTKPRVNRTQFDEVYGLDYFYEKYKLKYPPSMFGQKGTRPKKIDKSLYKKILMEYLDIYFKEIYFLDPTSYFLYTGSFRKVLYANRVLKNMKKIANASIGFFWFQRPSYIFHSTVQFIRLTGSTNRLPEIEKIYKKNFDINLIANFEEVIIAEKINNNLYIK
jgi:hypothetical protein